ncbi:MAG: NAD-dependent epimerase/dehydratase family protein [Alphaproteobacteria bacterium]
MTVLVTGAAGFIGYHVCARLLARGEKVIGVDNLNPYYDVDLKKARVKRLDENTGFVFRRLDIADWEALNALSKAGIRRVVHLAAQAGVRYSLEDPFSYGRANCMGQLAVLEFCRRLDGLEHLVYASSSSVYGGNRKQPFAVEDRVDRPISLYAASKRAGELMACSYSYLYRIPATGLRFFSVYGPWGRPDMAAYLFTRALFDGEPIRLFNHGKMKRDFTYIDDAVAGLMAALDRPPEAKDGAPPHRLYNIGNNRGEPLRRFVELLERVTGRTARIELAPMQPGDVVATVADIGAARADLGYEPRTTIDEGLKRFVAWYRDFHGT